MANDSKLEAVSKLIQAAVDRVTAAGRPIQTGDWGLDLDSANTYVVDVEGCLCPMACVLVGTAASDADGGAFETDAAVLLGIKPEQVSNFVVGFDGAECTVCDYQPDEYYHLGRTFRAKLVG